MKNDRRNIGKNRRAFSVFPYFSLHCRSYVQRGIIFGSQKLDFFCYRIDYRTFILETMLEQYKKEAKISKNLSYLDFFEAESNASLLL